MRFAEPVCRLAAILIGMPIYFAISTPPVAPVHGQKWYTGRQGIWTLLTECFLDIPIDGELTGGQSSLGEKVVLVSNIPLSYSFWKLSYHHEQTCPDTGVTAPYAKFLCDLDQTARGTLTRQSFGLVDLAQHGVGWL